MFNWSEVHLYQSNFLQNPYFSNQSHLLSFSENDPDNDIKTIKEEDMPVLPRPSQSNQPAILPSLPPPVELLVNAAIEIVTTEIVVANGRVAQARLNFEGGYTEVVNEGTPEFDVLSNSFNRYQEYHDYHHD